MSRAKFFERHKDFAGLFTGLEESTTGSIETISNKIIDLVKCQTESDEKKKMMKFATEKFYAGLGCNTKLVRRNFALIMLQFLRAFPELQPWVYQDLIKSTQVDENVTGRYRKTLYIGRIFGYNILLRLGILLQLKREEVHEIVADLVILSRLSSYLSDISLKTVCQIYDEVMAYDEKNKEEEDEMEPKVAKILLNDVPPKPENWNAFSIGVVCHILCSNYQKYRRKWKKKVCDASFFMERLFVRQIESRSGWGFLAWQKLARFGMMGKTLEWEPFWKDMQRMLAKPLQKNKEFSYHVFTCIINELGGRNYHHLIEQVLGFEFSRRFEFWVANKIDLTNLSQVLMRFAEEENAKFLFALVTALIDIDDFDKKLGAPVIETIMAKPERKRFTFSAVVQGLVERYTEVRKPFVEATEEQEQEIDEMVIEAKCKIIYEKLHRVCVAKTLSEAGERDWWLVGAKFFLQKSCFFEEAKRDKLAFATQPELSALGVSIIETHINLDISWLKDDNWEIDRIFRLVDSKALHKQYGPRLLNEADPIPDFKRAKLFLKKLPTLELTFVQRRLFEVIAKTCRLLLITEFHESCSKVFHIMLQEEMKLEDIVFEVVVTLIGNKSKLLGDLGILLWPLFVKKATGEHLEQLLKIASSIYCPEGDTDDENPEDSESSTTTSDDESVGPVPEMMQEGWKDEESDSSTNASVDDSKSMKPATAEKLELELVENKHDAESLLKLPAGKGRKVEDDGKEFNEEFDMMRKIVFSVLGKKRGNREKEIQRAMLPRVMQLLEIFSENRVGDPLILSMVFPLLECYVKDSTAYTLVKKILIRTVRREKDEEFPLTGIDMATLQVLLDDVISCMLMAKSKKDLGFIHDLLLWLCNLYFKVAVKEDLIGEALDFVQEHYKDFWSGLVSRNSRYKLISLAVFRSAMDRFPFLYDSLLDHIFQTAKEGKITKPFNQFETLCFISKAASWDPDLVIARHVEYAKVVCKLLPSLKKPIHIKTAILSLIKVGKSLTSEQKRELLKGSDLEKTLLDVKDVRVKRLMTLLKK